MYVLIEEALGAWVNFSSVGVAATCRSASVPVTPLSTASPPKQRELQNHLLKEHHRLVKRVLLRKIILISSVSTLFRNQTGSEKLSTLLSVFFVVWWNFRSRIIAAESNKPSEVAYTVVTWRTHFMTIYATKEGGFRVNTFVRRQKKEANLFQGYYLMYDRPT